MIRRRFEFYIRTHPFARLVQHFCMRTTGISSNSDFDFGLGGALGLLAVPGMFTSVLLMDKYSSLLHFLRGQRHFNPYLACLPDEYFFIVYSMAVTGLITLLRWDRLLPDARDFANIAPLSLALSKVFGANFLALAVLAAMFALDINLVSAVVFPLLVTGEGNSFGGVLEFAFAHGLAVLGISAFTFLALVAMQGCFMALLPDPLYRRMALILRTSLLILFAGTLISVFVLPLPFLNSNYASARHATAWPPLWFLSLFESHITFLKSHSAMGSTAAWRALSGALLLTVVGFSLSYKRYFLRIPERQSGLSTPSKARRTAASSRLSVFRPLFRRGFETACFQFTIRTLLRSETHLLLAGLWAGLGILLMLQGAPTLLAAPLTFTLMSLTGLRFIFDLPSHAQANWPFRLIAEKGAMVVRLTCRKLLLLAGLLPLLCVWLPIACFVSGWRLAISYLAFHVMLIGVLVEILLWRFRKIPFTCPFAANRDRLLKVSICLLLVLLFGLPYLNRIEAAVVIHPIFMPLFAAVFVVSFGWLFRNGGAESEVLLYQSGSEDAFVVLRLNS